MRNSFDNWLLAALTAGTAGLAAVMWHLGAATWLEAASFVTGALCVWLTVKESAWNFPISLINVTTFSFVFFEARLFADATLQVVYFVLTLVGWYFWLFGGENRTALRVARGSRAELAGVLFTVIAMTVLFWQTLRAGRLPRRRGHPRLDAPAVPR